ncbi:DNA mismatch repair protein MutL [Rubripirellula obstinata]|uniref:DNA mismatch repair protein MutL n=1 Tax=Rubripirellula obstinata TaxID=406547 RepID=A0A5B1CB89_9BACT|nr:DNA mismatch repair endonuclease MutL [Rubripirellula obstinata]KAA1258357.1 DNA mismatch repair protein MutL [Rubripirellula obstinata]
MNATTKAFPTIRQLPANLINQIAAGEVIERPASVVKELVENSIDAGSHRIEVSVTGGGTESIRISDDGCGMLPEQLPLAVASHATSKLPDDDSLFSVSTLGFRGEAMASIGSVSQMTIRSRAEGESVGSEMVVRGGVIEPVSPAGCPTGTVIEIRNLFFNTPVRHRFLKTAGTERGHIVEAFTRLALANPHIHFVLSNNDKVMHDLPAAKNWSERIRAFFGDEIAESLIPISDADDAIKISGYVSDPSVNRGNNRMQYLFLNGRHIRDRSLQHALGEAYRGLLMVGRFPVCFLRLDMPAELIDVNVHPTKLEVRFTDGGKVYGRLLQTLRHQFLRTDMTQRVGPASTGQETGSGPGVGREDPHVHRAPDPPQSFSSSTQVENQQRQAVINWARTGQDDSTTRSAALPPSLGNPAATHTPSEFSSEFPSGTPAFQPFDDGRLPSKPPADAAPWDTESLDTESSDKNQDAQKSPSVCYLGFQVHNRYLVTQDETGMVVIDQHALHERVLYERVCEKVLGEGSSLESQRLLVPEPVSLTPAERTTAIDAKETMAKIGLEIDDFGGDSIVISAYPAMLPHTPPADMLRVVLESLMSAGKDPDAKDLLNHLLSTIACKAAVKAGDPLSPEEITALLEQKDLYHDTHHCPHGRPTALFFSRDELDRMFGRLGPRGRV